MSRPDDSNPQLERLLGGYARSELRSIEREIASFSPCPAPEELRALEAGRIEDGNLRSALARHLVACPRCLDRNVALLAPRQAGEAGVRLPTAPVVAGRVGWIRAGTALAAAVLLGLAISLHHDGGSATPGALHGAYLVDEHGLELRYIPPPESRHRRRVLIHAASSGVVALARLSADGVRIEPIEGANLTTAVVADEEVVLPLDHSIHLDDAEDWLVLRRETPRADVARPPTAIELEAIAVRLARGELVPDWVGTRLAVRPPAND